MKVPSLVAACARLALRLRQEARRRHFRLKHARSAPHEIVCRVGGCAIKVRSDSILAEPLYAGVGFEDGVSRVLRKLAQPGFRVLDIGANIGLYSVLLGRAVGPAGRLWSFEPFAPVARLLRENIALNQLTNVTVLECAVSNTEGVSDFLVFPEGADVYNSLGARERPEGTSAVKTISVATITLDGFAQRAGLEAVDLIKLDIEGAEELALRGGERLLRRSPQLAVVTELFEPSAAQCGCSVSRVIQTLFDLGFRMHCISRDGQLLPPDPKLLAAEPYAVFTKGGAGATAD